MFFFIQHFQQVITQNSVQWSSLPQGFSKILVTSVMLCPGHRWMREKMQSAFYYRFTSPFTGYLPFSRHFIFIITLFISIITFLTKVCHHHLSRTSASYYHFLALSLVISLRCFRISGVVLQVVDHVLTVGVLNNLRVKWYIWKFPSVFNLYFYPLMFRRTK
jgi:hypothetical protein